MNTENADHSLFEEIEAYAVEIADRAGQILLEYFHQPLEVKFKGKQKTDPVTSADTRSEDYLKAAISKKFPDHSILSEEGGVLGNSDSPFIWVLDPLDGTANFVNGLPFFAVSVGVLWQMQPAVAGIYMPVTHKAGAGVYHARLGGGAYLDEERIEATSAMSSRPLSAVPVHGGGLRVSGKSRREPYEARNTGSIAVELALTASGIFRFAFFGAPKIWDVAAGVLLVKEAGGLAFARSRRTRTWIPVDQFRPDDGNEPSLERLRGWSRPIIAGAPDVTRRLVVDARGPRLRLSWPAMLRRSAQHKKNDHK